jgi:hypothetical protein
MVRTRKRLVLTLIKAQFACAYRKHSPVALNNHKGKVVPVLNQLSITPLRGMRSGYIAPPFLTSALDGGEWSASRPGHFTPSGEGVPGTHWLRGQVSPRTGIDYMEKRKVLPPPGLDLRPIGRPALTQSLYRLSYPGAQP